MPNKPTQSVRSRTESEYNTTLNYYHQWEEDLKKFPTFADFLLQKNIAQATRCKHLKQAEPYTAGTSSSVIIISARSPLRSPVFSDSDFQKLYEAFNDCKYPGFIQDGEQCRYWQCIMHFAAVTALRREAILGLTIDCINFEELFVTIPPDIDKKNTERYKPILPCCSLL